MTNIHVVDRLGVIDIGSNSVRLVVFEGANRSPSYFYNEKVLCGLGIGLARSGVLNPDGKERALRAIRRFWLICERMRLTNLRAVATEAVRRAKDGSELCQTVKSETGLDVEVISGIEEASLSAQGVLLSNPKASGVICDIGGASMEMAVLNKGKIGRVQSTRLGPMSIQSLTSPSISEEALIADGVRQLVPDFSDDAETLYLIGGSWRALAVLDMVRRDYPLHVLHEYAPPLTEISQTAEHVAKGELLDLAADTGLSQRRIDLLPIAAQVLLKVFEEMPVKTVRFSAYGLREGVLYNALDPEMRARDPLIAAARADESALSRFPGFGEVLFDWLSPIFGHLNEEQLRLVHAACLLHDVHWRSHPDYRAEVCFDAATHTNLSGLDHKGRVFLAFCLMHRYKPRGLSKTYLEVAELLSEEERELAHIVGLAIRLGAMMTSADAALMGELKLTEAQLGLHLPNQSDAIFGEVVAKRFNSLATAMNREAVVHHR